MERSNPHSRITKASARNPLYIQRRLVDLGPVSLANAPDNRLRRQNRDNQIGGPVTLIDVGRRRPENQRVSQYQIAAALDLNEATVRQRLQGCLKCDLPCPPENSAAMEFQVDFIRERRLPSSESVPSRFEGVEPLCPSVLADRPGAGRALLTQLVSREPFQTGAQHPPKASDIITNLLLTLPPKSTVIAIPASSSLPPRQVAQTRPLPDVVQASIDTSYPRRRTGIVRTRSCLPTGSIDAPSSIALEDWCTGHSALSLLQHNHFACSCSNWHTWAR